MRSSGSHQPAPVKLPPLSELISNKGSGLPNRYILHAVEGWGKTSFGAHTRKPIFIQSKGETGLETLIDAGRVANTAHFPECQTWAELRSYVAALLTQEHDYGTMVIDTLNGAERLCHEAVCARDFGGDWGERGFASYGKGPEVAASEWRLFLNDLDRLRIERKLTIFCLAHTKVQNFKNPDGLDFDRYQPELHKTTWSLTHKWADVILFGNFETTVAVEKESKRGKAKGGNHRVMYTERSAAFDAKNRLGLPAEVDMGESAAEAWKNFMAAIVEGRKQGIQNTQGEAA